MSEINWEYGKPKQTPYPVVEPASKYHLILLPDTATAQDITVLKCDALLAETKQQWKAARQLWMRVNVAARGTDMDAIEAIQRFPTFRIAPKPVESVIKPNTKAKSAPSPPEQLESKLNLQEKNDDEGAWGNIADGQNFSMSSQPIEQTVESYKSDEFEEIFTSFDESTTFIDRFEEIFSYIDEKNTNFSTISERVNSEKVEEPSALSQTKTDRPKCIIQTRYQQLDSYLKAQNFKDANQETERVMLEVFGKKENQLLNIDEIQSFPCEDLKTIDELWQKYSNGKFGFSVQKQIWIDLGGVSGEFDYEVYKKFAMEVRWYMDNCWVSSEKLEFSTRGAFGHLPRNMSRVDYGLYDTRLRSLFSRIEMCRM